MNGHVGNENDYESMTLSSYDPTRRGAVTIFNEKDCWGRFADFYADPDPRYDAKFTMDDMVRRGMPNNAAGSLFVPFGYSVTLY